MSFTSRAKTAVLVLKTAKNNGEKGRKMRQLVNIIYPKAESPTKVQKCRK